MSLERRHDALGPAVGAEHRRRADRHPRRSPSGRRHPRDEAGLRRAGCAARPRRAAARARPRRRRCRRRVEHRLGPAGREARRARAPEDLLGGGVAVGDDPAGVADDQPLGHRLHDRAQPLLVGASASPARVRSAVTAASTSDVSAAAARNSWLDSRLSVIDSRTNGPALCAVFQHRQPRDEHERGRGAARPEPQRRPDEHREHDVRDVALGRAARRAGRGRPAARRPRAPRAGPSRRTARVRPREQQRRHDERAREVRQPPRPPDLGELAGAR